MQAAASAVGRVQLPTGPRLSAGPDKPGTALQAVLDTMRVLLIHAGGYSQRLPSMSVCGKIFAPMPVSRRCLGGAKSATSACKCRSGDDTLGNKAHKHSRIWSRVVSIVLSWADPKIFRRGTSLGGTRT